MRGHLVVVAVEEDDEAVVVVVVIGEIVVAATGTLRSNSVACATDGHTFRQNHSYHLDTHGDTPHPGLIIPLLVPSPFLHAAKLLQRVRSLPCPA